MQQQQRNHEEKRHRHITVPPPHGRNPDKNDLATNQQRSGGVSAHRRAPCHAPARRVGGGSCMRNNTFFPTRAVPSTPQGSCRRPTNAPPAVIQQPKRFPRKAGGALPPHGARAPVGKTKTPTTTSTPQDRSAVASKQARPLQSKPTATPPERVQPGETTRPYHEENNPTTQTKKNNSSQKRHPTLTRAAAYMRK